ncbi:hypothetical protein VTN96DRAFT_10219 [Rasamsonia emersonii]|uniref:JmjC domain protein n=1 Tax=Rasamsonia emersonii (strain ATCC 16479 / CBS 393.64 / IMI 116815) TaxID=1408163 RepID=A0A0F4YPE6_RASE3|nr:JmjC domain protein [Rasamsonia emersonii CBS 393.64]KKA19980.1 JmjC domain protein [Rasamsonia emersonii CBS 393.64]
MPAQRPRAAFEPIPPDIDVTALVESTPNFEFVVRIHCDAIDEQGLENFEKLVLLHVILGGKPLVVEGYDTRLEKWIFSEQWLRDNYSTKTENARNLTTKSNLPLTIGHYLNNMSLLTDQWNLSNYTDPTRQRIYLKDIDCPDVWHEKLKEIIPPFLFYLNESTGDVGGVGATLEPNPYGPGVKAGRGIARAGDLMSSLPPEMRAENLMCYIGHEGTYTPCHQEMCASLGHNIMVEASSGLVEHGKLTKPGSSIWFMTETKDRHLVSEYWSSVLGHDIDLEDHFAQINAWKAAPFKTYVVEQRVGDFILIPPLAAHQVWNRGTRTMKVAWNRTTAETLEMALDEALPRARAVCRDEQYKNKAIVFYSLERYSKLLRTAEERNLNSPKIRQLQKDFRRLFALYTRILLSESFAEDLPEEKNVQFLPFESNVTCAYCRCNIFNRFLTCPSCVGKLPNGEDDYYDICMECYAMGRSCACISKLKWVEQFRWGELIEKHESWRRQILRFTGHRGDQYQPFAVEKSKLGKRTLAEVCQRELRRRPWVDITKPPARQKNDDSIIDDNDDGRPRKRRKVRRSEKWHKEHGRCHICKAPEPTWKIASCTSCDLNYCYGSLFRAFEIMPQTVLEDYSWKCPKCRKICSCGACRRDPTMTPYEPKGLLLGHDTRKVADPRSVEALVNFSHSNIVWLKKAGDGNRDDSRRLQRHREEAEMAKMHALAASEDYDELENEGPVEGENPHMVDYENIPIDPALGAAVGVPSTENGDDRTFTSASRKGQDDGFRDAAAIRFEYPDLEDTSSAPPAEAPRPTLSEMFPPLPSNDSEQALSSAIEGNSRLNGDSSLQDGASSSLKSGGSRGMSKRLIVRLKIGRKGMEAFVRSQRPADNHDKERRPTTSSAIIQSDLTNPNSVSQPLRPKSNLPKARKSRGEKDEDFTPGKGRAVKIPNNKLDRPKPTRAVRVNYFEDSDVSDDS